MRIHERVLIDHELVKNTRLGLSLTQQAIAERAGISFTTLSRIENARVSRVDVMTKKALESVLGRDLTPAARGAGDAAQA